jgi:hypothetical protein
MSRRPVGLCQKLSDTAFALNGNVVEINADPQPIYFTEFGISINGAPNSTEPPVQFTLRRSTAAGTGGTAGTVSPLIDGEADVDSTALEDVTVVGSLDANLHTVMVPAVSGVIWVAAPGREFSCVAINFMGINNVDAVPSGLEAAVYIVWEE